MIALLLVLLLVLLFSFRLDVVFVVVGFEPGAKFDWISFFFAFSFLCHLPPTTQVGYREQGREELPSVPQVAVRRGHLEAGVDRQGVPVHQTKEHRGQRQVRVALHSCLVLCLFAFLGGDTHRVFLSSLASLECRGLVPLDRHP